MLTKAASTLELIEARVKEDGYKIRYAYDHNKHGVRNKTFCALIKDDELLVGLSRTHPNDQFNKRLGRLKAICRATSNKEVMFKGKIEEFLNSYVSASEDGKLIYPQEMENIISSISFLRAADIVT